LKERWKERTGFTTQKHKYKNASSERKKAEILLVGYKKKTLSLAVRNISKNRLKHFAEVL
jgi:hypothetical protein